MAEPVLRAERVSPIVLRLTWDYDAAGDFQVYGKTSTPQGQDFVLWANTTNKYYEFTLNWSTTYYFKVRAASGTTITDFSNEIIIYCSCGTVYVDNAPPEIPEVTSASYFQQSADPSGDDIAFTFKDLEHFYQCLAERTSYFDPLDPSTELNGWILRYRDGYAESDAPGGLTPTPNPGVWDNLGTFFPTAVRNEGGVIATLDGVWWGSDYFGFYWFRLWDGDSLYTRHLGTDWWYDYYNEDYYTEWTPAFRGLPYSMEFDGAGKIVASLLFLDWYQRIDPSGWGMVLQVWESNDRGRSWVSTTIAVLNDNIEELVQCSMAKAGDGSYWITAMYFDLGPVTWYNPDTSPVYCVFKYESSGIEYSKVVENVTNTEEYFEVDIARLPTTEDPEPFVGQRVRFITGENAGEERGIIGYEYEGSETLIYYITVDSPFTAIPAGNDEFNIIGDDVRGATHMMDIPTNMRNTYGPPPHYTQTGWDTQARSCVIATEGDKIAIAYVYDIEMLTTPPAAYAGRATIKVMVSNDNGASWATNDVYIDGEDIHWDLEWTALLPTITISSGNLIMYLCEGAETLDGYRIIKSTDDGETWATVFSFPGIDPFVYPHVFQLRSDGDHVTLTGCKAAETTGGSLALWESTDGGDTWAGVEVNPLEIPAQVI